MAEVRKAAVVAAAVSLSSVQADEEALRRVVEMDFPVDQRTAFTERRYSPLLRKPIVQHGVVWVDGTGDVVMQIQTPRLEERRIENDRLVLRRPNRRDHRSREDAIESAQPRYRALDRSRPMHLALWAAAQVIAGDITELQAHFRIVLGPSEPHGTETVPAGWSIELIPRDSRARSVLPAIRLHGRANQLEHVRVDRGKGRRYDVSFAPEPGEGYDSPRPAR